MTTKGTGTAEPVELLENTSRHIEIPLVNEMARFSHDLRVDSWDLIAVASTNAFGLQPFMLDPGAIGNRMPIRPNYLSDRR